MNNKACSELLESQTPPLMLLKNSSQAVSSSPHGIYIAQNKPAIQKTHTRAAKKRQSVNKECKKNVHGQRGIKGVNTIPAAVVVLHASYHSIQKQDISFRLSYSRIRKSVAINYSTALETASPLFRRPVQTVARFAFLLAVAGSSVPVGPVCQRLGGGRGVNAVG